VADPGADPAVHRRHDRLAIAAAIDGGTAGPSWQGACLACTSLYTDLVAIRSSIPTSTIPPRLRDHRLTAADAERLRRRAWRSMIGAIGTSRDAVTRPLATSLTTLGLAGLLLGSVPAIGGSLGLPGAGGATMASHRAEVWAPRAVPTVVDGVATTGGEGATGVAVDGRTPLERPMYRLSLVLLAGGATLFGARRLAIHLGSLR
jgi:hypothetical protein